MRRYAVRRSKLIEADDYDFWFPQSVESPMVYEGEEDYEDTGLVDEYGNDIMRFVGVLPIGFLADHSDEDEE